MPNRHSPTIHIDSFRRKPQLLHHAQRLHTKRFIQLEQFHLFHRPTRTLQHLLHARHRSQHHPLRRNSTRSLRLDRRHHLQSKLLRTRSRHHHQRRRRIIHSRSIPRCNRPILLERRLQRRKCLQRSILPHTLISVYNHHTLLATNLNRHNLRIKSSLSPRRRSLAMRLQRISVLLLPRNRMLLRNQLSRHAHMEVLTRAPQPILHHRIHHRTIAHAISLASTRQQIRRIRHRLHPTRHHNFSLAIRNRLRS